MTGILSNHVDTAACRALERRYGPQLQQLSTSTRLHLAAALACAAAAVEQDGISEHLDIAFADVFPEADAELLQLLRDLDGQLGTWGEAAALCGAIADSLCFASI